MLTASERKIAAECARKYPKGYGEVFFAIPDAPSVQDDAVRWMEEDPKLLEKG